MKQPAIEFGEGQADRFTQLSVFGNYCHHGNG